MSDNKYISLNRLADFLRNLNDKFAKSVHTHTITDIEDYKEPDLTGLALKSDIPSIDGLATEAFVHDETLLKAEQELTDEELNQVHKNLKLDNYASKDYVESLYKKLNSNTVLGFYCIEDVTIVINGISKTYPANSNVEVKFIEGETFEIIPTSDNSILSLSAFPGALGTFYPWLEGVKQFSNILFDMNSEDMYTKWNQGNQGSYQVQYAQYTNCIFWSDNPYISELSKRTNYTLYYSSQLPLCYSTIPENTFKAFYLAFGVNSDPNWGNKTYRDSFANANWATQVFSYYGARTIGIFGHDDPDFNIVLPADCRGLMSAATAIENAGTFDAINTTNFGAKSGSWRDAFGWCGSLRNLYIKNLKVNLNVSWSPLEYDSIYFIISEATNTSAITITVSPYTYNLLSQSDFELAASKNITIALLTTNYVEDKRLSTIADKADKSYVDERVAELVNSAPETLDTLGELAAAFQDNEEVVNVLNEAIVTKADKAYVDELVANIPTESDIVIVDCPDGSVISHTFEQIMTAVNNNKTVYVSIYGATIASLAYIADDNSFIEFNAVRFEVTEDQCATAWIDGIVINNDNSFVVKHVDLLSRHHNEIESSDGEKDIIAVINNLVENKADKSEIPSLDGLATETWVAEYVNEAIKDLEPAEPTPGEAVTTEYVYTYDGNTDNEDITWVTNYGGVKSFAKMGDLPKGTLNLVGATLFRTNPSNAWLDRSFTITEEHLTKVLNKSNTDVPATQDGLIQIYDSMASDFSEFTVACICTVTGWYNVCFDDWYEIIYFPETGIYGYDKRTFGGNDYLKSFTFTATYVQNEIPEEEPVEVSPIKYAGSEIQMFHRGICIGDSVTEGSFDNDENGIIVKEYSYPSILKRLTNIDIVNAGIAGATSQTWYEASLNSDSLWGKWFNQEWVWNMNPTATSSDAVSSTLDYSGFDFAIIHLGINDLGLTYDTTPIEEVLATFEVYMGNIITKLKEANTGIKIFLATIIPSYAVPGNQNYVMLNDTIKSIAEATENAYLLDLNQYSEVASDPAYNRTHPTALGYHKIASEIKALISYIIKNNLDEFKTVQFIPTATVGGFTIQTKSQEEYDALVVKDPNTLYIIV